MFIFRVRCWSCGVEDSYKGINGQQSCKCCLYTLCEGTGITHWGEHSYRYSRPKTLRAFGSMGELKEWIRRKNRKKGMQVWLEVLVEGGGRVW